MYRLAWGISHLLNARRIQRLLESRCCRKRLTQDVLCLSLRHVSVQTHAFRIEKAPATIVHWTLSLLDASGKCLVYMDVIINIPKHVK